MTCEDGGMAVNLAASGLSELRMFAADGTPFPPVTFIGAARVRVDGPVVVTIPAGESRVVGPCDGSFQLVDGGYLTIQSDAS